MDFYQVLGVRQGAHPAEIDLAFKTISQVPDLDIETRLELAVAHQTLLHPQRRAEYDRGLAQPAASAPVVVYRNSPPPAQSKANQALTGFFTCYMLGFAAMGVIGLVALIL